LPSIITLLFRGSNNSNPSFWHRQASRLCSIHICGLFRIFLFSSINNSVYLNMNSCTMNL
jgi:hypothetical protein